MGNKTHGPEQKRSACAGANSRTQHESPQTTHTGGCQRGFGVLKLVSVLLMLIGTAGPSAVSAAAELRYLEALFDGQAGVGGLAGAWSVAVSPDGRHVYAAGKADNAVVIFSRDASQGNLTFIGSVADGQNGVDGLGSASAVALSPDGRYVYVAGETDNTIAVFSRDVLSGMLTFVQAAVDGNDGVDGLRGPSDLIVSPDGKHLYAAAFAGNGVLVFERNDATGGLAFVESKLDGEAGVDGLQGASSVALSPDGRGLYATGRQDSAVSAFSRDPATGILTFRGALFDGQGGVDGLGESLDVAVSPDGGNVYVAAWGDDAVSVFSRDSETAALTFLEAHFNGINDVFGLHSPWSIRVLPGGQFVYLSGFDADAVNVFARDRDTGSLAFVEALFEGEDGVQGLTGPRGLGLSPAGDHLYVATSDDAVVVFRRITRQLVVSPNAIFGTMATGQGVFSPSGKDYLLRNTGDGTLSYTVDTQAPWLSIAPQFGNLEAGAQHTVSVSVNDNIGDLSPGILHEASVVFANDTDETNTTVRGASALVLPADSEWDIASDVGFDDDTSLMAGGVPDGGTATLMLLVERPAQAMAAGKQTPPTNIGFKVKTSTEAGKDVLRFSIDGEQLAEWSGETEWIAASFPIPPGLGGDPAEIVWTYGKDDSGASGEDAVYIDVLNPTVDDVRIRGAVLPTSRSAQVGTPVTAFATVINSGSAPGDGCAIAPANPVAAVFSYQLTDPLTNAPTGLPDTPAPIPSEDARSFVFAFMPNAPFHPEEIEFIFDCSNSEPANSIPGVNTLLLSASDVPVPDVVALVATLSGDGIVHIPGASGAAAFSVATVNLGAAAMIRASVDTGSANLPLAVALCESDPGTGLCTGQIADSVSTQIGSGDTPTFAVFAAATGSIDFDPAGSRIFVRFSDGDGVVRGSTSVAVETQ